MGKKIEKYLDRKFFDLAIAIGKIDNIFLKRIDELDRKLDLIMTDLKKLV